MEGTWTYESRVKLPLAGGVYIRPCSLPPWHNFSPSWDSTADAGARGCASGWYRTGTSNYAATPCSREVTTYHAKISHNPAWLWIRLGRQVFRGPGVRTCQSSPLPLTPRYYTDTAAEGGRSLRTGP